METTDSEFERRLIAEGLRAFLGTSEFADRFFVFHNYPLEKCTEIIRNFTDTEFTDIYLVGVEDIGSIAFALVRNPSYAADNSTCLIVEIVTVKGYGSLCGIPTSTRGIFGDFDHLRRLVMALVEGEIEIKPITFWRRLFHVGFWRAPSYQVSILEHTDVELAWLPIRSSQSSVFGNEFWSEATRKFPDE